MTRARARLVLTGAARRRVFGEYQSSEPSRFIDEVPAELVERVAPSFSAVPLPGQFPALRVPDEPVRPRPARPRTRRGSRPTRTRTRISRRAWRCGRACACATRSSASARCISVEALDDDTKLVVRFAAVGQKTLRAKYAQARARREVATARSLRRTDRSFVASLRRGYFAYQWWFNPTASSSGGSASWRRRSRCRPTSADIDRVARLAQPPAATSRTTSRVRAGADPSSRRATPCSAAAAPGSLDRRRRRRLRRRRRRRSTPTRRAPTSRSR